MAISNEVEVVDRAGPVRLVEEGESVPWKTLGDTQEEEQPRQPESGVILINVGTRLTYNMTENILFDSCPFLFFLTVRTDQN